MRSGSAQTVESEESLNSKYETIRALSNPVLLHCGSDCLRFLSSSSSSSSSLPGHLQSAPVNMRYNESIFFTKKTSNVPSETLLHTHHRVSKPATMVATVLRAPQLT